MEPSLPRGFTIGLTPGCPAGIGPETWAKALALLRPDDVPKTVRLRWFASAALLLEGCRRAGVNATRGDDVVVIHGDVHRGGSDRTVAIAVTDADCRGRSSRPGVVDEDALACQRDALVRACVAAAAADIDALVTGPARKAALVDDGVAFAGQTEFVHKYLHDDDGPPLMVFAGGPFVLGLFTVHMALRDVASHVTTPALERAIRRLREATMALAGVERPRIVVLGLNPHAGEGGLFGDEEEKTMKPLVQRLKEEGIDVDGPVPADGFFADVARHKKGLSTMPGVHGVLAMHHDQGLAPYKILAGGEGVNVTWGLRVPRTSPDHGTADALAGSGKADPSSTVAALTIAVRLAAAARA